VRDLKRLPQNATFAVHAGAALRPTAILRYGNGGVSLGAVAWTSDGQAYKTPTHKVPAVKARVRTR
jgi:hypothetical protein